MTATLTKAPPRPAPEIKTTPERQVQPVNMRLARWALSAALFGLLYSLYLVTYSGTFTTDDERFIFDTTESLAERGTLYLNQTTYVNPYRTSGIEPGQPLLAVPLYLLADQITSVGTVQTTYLFNPIVTALTTVVLFWFALDLGYDVRVALIAGLLFGAGTIAWPYAKTFFREPLAGLSLAATLFFLHRWRAGLLRDHNSQNRIWLVLGVAAYLISAFTKEAALIAAPVIVAYTLPPIRALRDNRRVLLFLGLGALAMIVLLVTGTVFLRSNQAIAGRYAILESAIRLLNSPKDPVAGILGLLFSPGKSVFVYSPAALLVVGALVTRRPEGRREQWLAVGLLGTFVVLYAIMRGPLWHGGSGWGPRYLVPLSPLLVLGGLPLVKWALDSSNWWPKVGLGLLAALSVTVQVPGLLINIFDYYRALEPLGSGAPWTIAIWQPRYSQVLGHLRLFDVGVFDVAWARPATDWMALAVLVGGALVLGGQVAWLAVRPVARRGALLAIGGSVLLVLGLTGFALRRAFDDPYFLGDAPHLHELVAYLQSTASQEDAIVLSNPHYVNFFANYYKGDTEWLTMPRSPGERHSEEQVPLVVSDDPEELVAVRAAKLFKFALWSRPRESVWLVVDGGPYTPWYPRPPEWWAAERYYTVHTQEFAPTARLVKYLSYNAPEPESPPAFQHGAKLGDEVVLAGYDLAGYYRPDVHTFHPGDELGVSLTWYADDTLEEDFIAAVYLIAPDGNLYMQQDRVPVASFRPTSSWEVGETMRDNYGFVLPEDAPLGRWEIWTTMYSWPSLERLPAASPDGEHLGDVLVVTEFDLLDPSVPLD